MSEIPYLNHNRTRPVNPYYKVGIILVIAFVLAGLGTGGYFYWQYRQNSLQNAAQRNLAEAKRLSEEIGKFMLLPSNEVPTIATVTDASKISNQDFFKYAKNGDKVLIFTKAQMAILYSPSLHKIINVGPVNVGSQPNQSPQARIAILNGTLTDGLAAREQINLQAAFKGANIVKTGTANNTGYTKTIVVAFNPLAKSAAQALADFYGITVTSLPSTESPQDGVDILVIIGKDRVESSSTLSSPSSTAK